MHAGVGISIRPWLITTTTTAANSSALGSFSKWATTISLSPVHSVSYENGKRFAVLRSGGGRVFEKGFRCAAGGDDGRAGLVTDLSTGPDRRQQTGWGWNRRHSASGLGLSVSSNSKEGRDLLVTSARRGFLSELQSLREERDAAPSVPVSFESPLQIVLYPDPRLRKKNERVTVFDEKLEQLVKEMFEVMYNTDGVGLAAPQVGVNVQLMLYNPEGERGKGAEYILVNPKISKYGKQRDVFREGCLSFLQLEADVERPLNVRVEAQDIRGKKFGISLKGWQARIFQHEYDHLDGVLYHDRMTTEQIDTIRSGLVRLEEEYEKRTGLSTPETVK